MKSKKKISKISIIAKSTTIKEKNKIEKKITNSTNQITLTEPSTDHSQSLKTLPVIKEKKILNKEENEKNKSLPNDINIESAIENNMKINTNNNNENNNENNNTDSKKKFSFFYFHKTHNLYFFIKKPNKKQKEITSKNFELKHEIELPSSYYPYMNNFDDIQECHIETCKNGNFGLKTNLKDCNIIWKLQHRVIMESNVKKLTKYQKFSYFPTTYILGRKDNMYRKFKHFQKLFPNDFKYIPLTFIMPSDGDKFKEIDGDLKKLWIVKPVNLSRGRGIHILKDQDELWRLTWKSIYNMEVKNIVSKYISNPHTIGNKKYDLRIYVLIGSYTPLRIYLYDNGLVRFATEDYNKNNTDNVYVYLTNFSININNPKYKNNNNYNEENEEYEEDDSSKWSLYEYKKYFIKIGREDLYNKIWDQIIDIVIKSIVTIANESAEFINFNKLNSIFELYGFDIMIDENFKCWLIEVNVKPSMHCTSSLDLNIKTDLITDIFNIVGVYPFNHYNSDLIYSIDENNKNILPQIKKKKPILYQKQTNTELINLKSDILRYFNPNNLSRFRDNYSHPFYTKIIQDAIEEIERSSLTDFNLIFPKKDNLEYYAKFLTKEGTHDTNIVFWQYILTNE